MDLPITFFQDWRLDAFEDVFPRTKHLCDSGEQQQFFWTVRKMSVYLMGDFAILARDFAFVGAADRHDGGTTTATEG